jgi:hypothetical protein
MLLTLGGVLDEKALGMFAIPYYETNQSTYLQAKANPTMKFGSANIVAN